eukprot:3694122-Heterocapsa_arctica.AAC.1
MMQRLVCGPYQSFKALMLTGLLSLGTGSQCREFRAISRSSLILNCSHEPSHPGCVAHHLQAKRYDEASLASSNWPASSPWFDGTSLAKS